MSTWSDELRFAARALWRTPRFAAVAALTLALGVGANTAIFAVVRGVVLRPLSYPEPDRLVRLWTNQVERGLAYFSVSPDDYLTWRERARSFSAMGAFERQSPKVLTGRGTPRQVMASPVTPELMPVLGVAPLLGRAISEEDARAGARVVMLAHEFWTTELGSDPAVLGQTIMLDAEPFAVIAVMPPGFAVPMNDAVMWLPSMLETGDRSNRHLRVLARLAPGATPETAREEMRTITATLARTFPATNAGWSITLQTIEETIVGPVFRRALTVLLGVVAFVLLVACANVSNLFLSRAATRRHEIAVRAALGASRGRIARQWLAEGVVLGLSAAPAGLLFGLWCLALLRTLGAADVPRIDEVRLDETAAVFAATLSLLTGVVLAAAPAVLALRTRMVGSLTEGARGVAGGRAAERLRTAVVVAQVALAVILLVGATLLLHSFRRLSQVSLGFDPAGAAAVQVPLPAMRYDPGDDVRFFDELLARVRALPGVEAAGAVTSLPFAGQSSSNLFFPDHMVIARRDEAPDADYRVITPGYLDALGLRLVRGRDFDARDRERGDVALISETMAARYWPDVDPIGQRFHFGSADGRQMTIVGIVGDARYQSVEASEVRPMMYFVHSAEAPAQTMSLVVRSSLPAEQVFAGVRSTMAALDPELAIALAITIDDLVEGSFAQPRFHAVLFVVFATLALVLSGVGLYAVMAYAVAQRTREIGVRAALGARSRDVVALVCSRGLRLVAIGLAVGITAAWWLTRVMAALLFQTSPREPAAFLAVVALLVIVALVACWLPARRAARLDPVAALRA